MREFCVVEGVGGFGLGVEVGFEGVVELVCDVVVEVACEVVVVDDDGAVDELGGEVDVTLLELVVEPGEVDVVGVVDDVLELVEVVVEELVEVVLEVVVVVELEVVHCG